MPGAMQIPLSRLWKFIAIFVGGLVFVVLLVNRADRRWMQVSSSNHEHELVIDALRKAEERSIVVFKDGEMGYVTRAGLYGHLEVKERCSTRLVPAPTRTPSFLERIEKVVRVDDPNYQELRIEYIARCFLTHGR